MCGILRAVVDCGLVEAPTEPESRLHSSDPAKLETLIQGTLRLTVGGQDGAPASRIHQTSEPGETEPGRPFCDLWIPSVNLFSLDPLVFPFG